MRQMHTCIFAGNSLAAISGRHVIADSLSTNWSDEPAHCQQFIDEIPCNSFKYFFLFMNNIIIIIEYLYN